MKKLFMLLTAALFVAGCSKPAEESKSEKLGTELANKIRAPIDDARAVTEKLNKRELPPMDE